MRGAGTAGEDIKYQVCTVYNTAPQLIFNIAYLTGGKLIIKDCQGDLPCSNKGGYLFDFTLIDKGARIGMINALKKRPCRDNSGCLCQKSQLLEVVTCCGLIYLRGDDPDKYCSFYLRCVIFS